eukprot:2682140-Amphidinium_carterae.1
MGSSSLAPDLASLGLSTSLRKASCIACHRDGYVELLLEYCVLQRIKSGTNIVKSSLLNVQRPLSSLEHLNTSSEQDTLMTLSVEHLTMLCVQVVLLAVFIHAFFLLFGSVHVVRGQHTVTVLQAGNVDC